MGISDFSKQGLCKPTQYAQETIQVLEENTRTEGAFIFLIIFLFGKSLNTLLFCLSNTVRESNSLHCCEKKLRI